MADSPIVLGVLGGSGVYDIDDAELVADHDIETPYGKPSDTIKEVVVDNRRAFFLPRHGRGHTLLPSEVNYRANIYALKTLGVNHLLAVSAVGIMQDNIKPGDLVIPDQMFDRTKGVRESSFFGNGIAGHIEFADPFSKEMSEFIYQAAKLETDDVYQGGSYVCIEGPQFSTRAESRHYRETLTPSVIGMTGLPEAKLAREAEICYGMLALATDYDCWKEGDHDDVTVEAVIAVLKANSAKAKAVVKRLMEIIPDVSRSAILDAAKYAIITPYNLIPDHRKNELAPLYGKYFDV